MYTKTVKWGTQKSNMEKIPKNNKMTIEANDNGITSRDSDMLIASQEDVFNILGTIIRNEGIVIWVHFIFGSRVVYSNLVGRGNIW